MNLSTIGFGGRALLYGMTALLAGRAAFGLPGEAGAQGVFEALADLPLGIVALSALAVALAVFGVWAAIQALHRDAVDGLRERLGRGGQAVVYLALAVLAAGRVLGGGGGGGGGRSASATLMSNPAGRVAVGLVAVGLLVVAGLQVRRAVTGNLRERLDRDGGGAPGWALPVGRIGYAGRGVTLGLVGAVALKATFTFDPEDATGLDAALDELVRTPGGRVWVVLVALGMAALAAWFVLVARHGVRGDVDREELQADRG